jgi:predicted transcriptional regulator
LKKSDVFDLLRDMPDDLDPEELIWRLYLKEKIERAEAAVAAGDVVSHAEVEKMIDEWSR